MSEIPDLLERFRRGPELVAVATTGASNQELDFTAAPGKWSVRQIVCHLADFELAGAIRIRQVLCEDNPTLQGYDENLWATRLDHTTRKISAAVEGFRRVRTENYDLLRNLPEDTFARRATHSERGPMTLLDVLRLMAQHAESHSKQILGVRQAYKSARAQG
jgi:hypothetical protein